MTLLRPDQTFYPSPQMACKAPAEKLAYVATLNYGRNDRPDGIGVVDLDPESPRYGQVVHTLEMPYAGDELHHFGWNACSSALCPYAPHPHLERRYLIVPGIRSSRIYIIDTRPDPARPKIAKIIEPDEVIGRSGYSRPHTIHCGPDAIYVSALGGKTDGQGPGGIFMLDHYDFDVLGPWEIDRGAQQLAYDFWWHITENTMITSEWGIPAQFESGLNFDDQFYPDKMGGWMAKLDVGSNGGISFDENFFVDFGDTRTHQVRLEGGDASTDTFCYAS